MCQECSFRAVLVLKTTVQLQETTIKTTKTHQMHRSTYLRASNLPAHLTFFTPTLTLAFALPPQPKRPALNWVSDTLAKPAALFQTHTHTTHFHFQEPFSHYCWFCDSTFLPKNLGAPRSQRLSAHLQVLLVRHHQCKINFLKPPFRKDFLL